MLYYNTVNDLLLNSLLQLMAAPEFNNFRLVGGTALSLRIGHRASIVIDLFTDVAYGDIDFKIIDTYIETHFPYADHLSDLDPGIGKSYFVGNDMENTIKLDVFYTDKFMQPAHIEDHIRMATIEEIIAMKLDVIQRGGRKKDFWDLHELFDSYSMDYMLKLHEQRYPYSHDSALILKNFVDFSQADDDFDPICIKGKYWEFIKEDIADIIQDFCRKQ